ARDGTLVAFDADIVMDGGAYMTLSPVVLSRGAIHAAGAYRWPHARIHARAIATHTPPNGAFRGFGAPQTLFATECHLDRIAERLGMDPLTLRLKNAVTIGDVTPTGQVLRESVGALDVLSRTAAMADWSRTRERLVRENAAAAAHEVKRVRRRAAAHRPGSAPAPPARRLRRGLGISLALHGAGFTGSGEVRLGSI